MGKSTTAYIGLGSNLGDRRRFIEDAVSMLDQNAGIDVTASTEPVETVPLGGALQPKYLNAVCELKTDLSCEQLYRELVKTEDALGRKRGEKWSCRTIDMDLLLFGNEIVNREDLMVPHPQMHLRSFVLGQLCKLKPKMVHPVLGETIEVLSSRLNGGNYVPAEKGPLLVNIAGNIGAGKTTLTKALGAAMSYETVFEAYDTNPFLPKVYAGQHDLALDSQLYFLASRAEQLSPDALAAGKPVITDYVQQKELIYAKTLLSGEQMKLYMRIYRRLSSAMVRPALLIYLRVGPDKCLERILNRNRPYEREIELPFLESLGSGYEQLVKDWDICPVMTLDEFDCLKQQAVDELARQVRYYINSWNPDMTVMPLKASR